jgi:hypothetical protein
MDIFHRQLTRAHRSVIVGLVQLSVREAAMDAHDAWASFAHAQAKAWGDLAENLLDVSEQPASVKQVSLDLEEHNLGARQVQIVKLSGLRFEEGLRTSEIATKIGYEVPNTYSTLQALARRGVIEQVPNKEPQRWRLARRYRAARPYPWEDVDMDVIRGQDAKGRFYVRCCCDWLTSSLNSEQVADALRTHVERCPDAITAGIEQENVLIRILSAESIDEMHAIFEDDDAPNGDHPPDVATE